VTTAPRRRQQCPASHCEVGHCCISKTCRAAPSRARPYRAIGFCRLAHDHDRGQNVHPPKLLWEGWLSYVVVPHGALDLLGAIVP